MKIKSNVGQTYNKYFYIVENWHLSTITVFLM